MKLGKNLERRQMRILLVEDEPEMGRLVGSIVRSAGFAVDFVSALADAREATRQHPYDLVLLDRRLPDGDGVSFVPTLRSMRPGARIMVLTALDAVSDKVVGLDAGADDYLTKPFQAEELIARIRACLRRPAGEVIPPIVVGALSLDLRTLEVTINGRPLALNKRELLLLQALMRRADRVTTRETLVEEIYSLDDNVQSNTLDTVVSRLRRRLDALGSGTVIHTVRGIGYMMCQSAAR